MSILRQYNRFDDRTNEIVKTIIFSDGVVREIRTPRYNNLASS